MITGARLVAAGALFLVVAPHARGQDDAKAVAERIRELSRPLDPQEISKRVAEKLKREDEERMRKLFQGLAAPSPYVPTHDTSCEEVNRLIQRLKDSSPVVREQAAIALGEINQSIRRALQKALADSSDDVKNAAARALRIDPSAQGQGPAGDASAQKRKMKSELIDLESSLTAAQEAQRKAEEDYKRDSEAYINLKKERDQQTKDFNFLAAGYTGKKMDDLQKTMDGTYGSGTRKRLGEYSIRELESRIIGIKKKLADLGD
jgi:hypothetical protein